jgi:hypothetical protein
MFVGCDASKRLLIIIVRQEKRDGVLEFLRSGVGVLAQNLSHSKITSPKDILLRPIDPKNPNVICHLCKIFRFGVSSLRIYMQQ